jgi:hypothetical protein
VLLWAAGVLLLAYQIRRPADAPPALFVPTGLVGLREAAHHFLVPLADAFAPLSLEVPAFATKGLLIVGGLVACLAAFVLAWDKRVLTIWILSSLVLLLFLGIYFDSQLRHHGLLFVFLVSCLWASGQFRPAGEQAPSAPAWQRRLWVCLVLLLPQFPAGPLAVAQDIRRPFSSGREAAALLYRSGLVTSDTLIATCGSQNAIGILPYLPPAFRFYQLEYRRFGSFMVWNRERSANANLPIGEVLRRVSAESRRRGYRQVVLILGTEGTPVKQDLPGYQLLGSFGGTRNRSDAVAIYRQIPSPRQR